MNKWTSTDSFLLFLTVVVVLALVAVLLASQLRKPEPDRWEPHCEGNR